MPRFSIHAHPWLRSSGSNFGYSYSFNEISKHIRLTEIDGKKLQVDLNSPKSKMQLHYGTPPGSFYPHQYKIQMTQWESTLAPPAWLDFSKNYDEWWTANQFGADAFANCGIPEEKIHVYEHGVDSQTWTPKLRGLNKKIRFLHIDSGSPRKRADLAIEAFSLAFGDNPDFELTLKYSHHPSSGADWSDLKTLQTHGEWSTKNIRHIKETVTLDELVALFHFHDVLLYPSEGEGFGLIPLQALVTGMPIVSTSRWCSYEKYFSDHVIDSTLGKSKTVETYERYGDVVLPDLDSFVQQLKNITDNFDSKAKSFYEQSPQVSADYDWQRRTDGAMNSLLKRVGAEMFNPYLMYLK